MTAILDTGALIALERNDREMWVRLKGALASDDVPVTHAGVVGQAWRGGPQQARLASALGGIEVRAVDEALGRLSGQLLAASGLSDVIDAAVALLAHDGDDIFTSDPKDLEALLNALDRHVELIGV